MENDMTLQHTDEDPIYFEHYDSEALHEILDTQHKKTTTEYTKKNNFRLLFQILIVSDDFADDPSFARQSQMLRSLYVRGRRNMMCKGRKVGEL